MGRPVAEIALSSLSHLPGPDRHVAPMRSRTTALPTAVLIAFLLAACGGGGGGDDGVASLSGEDGDGGTTSTTLSEEDQEEAMLDWTACMREQGIDMPDPQVDGNGRTSVIIGGSAGVDDDDDDATEGDGNAPPDRATFEAAQEECGEPPMQGREISDEDREEMEAQGLEFAECIRDNGIEDFPDPDFSDQGPGSGPATRVERFDDDDDADRQGSSEVVAGPFGVIELDDPEVKAAFETCQDTIGFGPGGPGGSGGPPVAVAESSS